MLLVQNYLKSGKTLDDLYNDHGVKCKETNGKLCLNYNQLESKNTDPLACQCRGLILRKDTFDIVAYPMDRFFNLEQKDVAADIDWDSACFFEKVDGTAIFVYFDEKLNKWCCGTRSRAEADVNIDDNNITFSDLVNLVINKMWHRKHPGCLRCCAADLQEFMEKISDRSDKKDRTFVFEITSIFNRIVCKYNEDNLTLLAVRNIKTLQEEDPNLWIKDDNCFGLKVAKSYSFNNINHIIKTVHNWDPSEHEGIVVRDKFFNRIKIKNPKYVIYNHMRDSLDSSIKRCVEVILLEKEDDIIGVMPKIIGDRILRVKPIIQHVFKQTQKDYEEIKHIENQKEFASVAQLKLWPSAIFALRHGKISNVKDFIVKKNNKISNNNINMIINICKKIDSEAFKIGKK